MVIFHSYVNVYQRVYAHFLTDAGMPWDDESPKIDDQMPIFDGELPGWLDNFRSLHHLYHP